MSFPLRLTVFATLVFAVFALWQARVEYLNYNPAPPTVPRRGFDPFILYEIATLATPTVSPTAVPRATATSHAVRTVYQRTTSTTTTVVASNTPSPTPRTTATASATPLPSVMPSSSPAPQPDGDETIRFTIEPQNATWHDTITVSWEVPDYLQGVHISYENDLYGDGTPILGLNSGWYGLETEGSQTMPLTDIVGTACQTPLLIWELVAYQPNGEMITTTVTSTISYPDVPLTLRTISISPNPAPAYGPVTLMWEGQGGTGLRWYGHSGMDSFGVDAGKHWRELRLEGASGTTSWLLNRHTPSNVYTYNYSMLGLPGICGTVELQMTCPYDYWIDEPEQRTEESCPTSPPVTIPAAYQTFERGVMVWDSDLKMIYVLYNDGTTDKVHDYWNGETITFPESPPPGLLLPQQGFGYYWTTADFVHERLGWATAPEQVYIMTRQQVKNEISGYLSGYEIRGPIYFTLPDGRVVRV